MCYQWHLNPILLLDKEFVNFNSSKMTLFLETNSTPGMSCFTTWESLKANLRGQIIYFSTKQNIARSQQDLSEAIAAMDEKYATDPSSDLQ